jgi:mitochondrial FAD-linked sulfhydryl oxidase
MRCLLFLCLLALCVSRRPSRCACSCDSERMDEVGRAGWRFMHTLAANYPEQPHFYQKFAWYGFFETIINFYPCEYCRNHLWDNVDKYGIRVANRTDISMYLCFLHNDVNKENGRAVFPCEMEILQAKYGFDLE